MTRQTPAIDPPPFEPPAPPLSGPGGFAGVAWVLILLGTIGAVAMQYIGVAGPDDGKDPIGLVMMKMQAQYVVGAAEFQGGGALLYGSVSKLNAGTIGQRQRFVPLAGELIGPGEAADQTADLDALIEQLVAGGELVLTEEQAAVQEIFHKLYPERDGEVAQLDALDDAERALLVDQLGWFGELALAPPGTAGPVRDATLESASKVFFIILSVAGVIGLAGLAGFVGLVIVGVLALIGRVPSGMGAGLAPHGIYAETFAIWLPVFFGFQIVAGIIGSFLPGAMMLLAAIAFFLSLVVLAWPVLRGIPWADVRQDIGWHSGRQPLLEPIVGVASYLMGLPILAAGIGLTLVLIFVQAFFSGTPAPLAPTGGPAHPIILEVAGGSWAAHLQILLVAAVAAPIVEETMFRGVLYRHLRDASSKLGIGLSILLSTLLNAFVFAVIHPQGWVAIPALMSLAIAFTLAREWRGTVMPSMLMHALNNALVMTMLFGLFSV